MNVNKVLLIGNLTRDPELRTTPTGQPVATFSIATNRVYTDNSGNKKQQAEFHNIVAWGRLAEIANQYLSKGKMVFIEGRLATRSWQGNDGIKKSRTEIIVERMQLGPRGNTQRANEEASNNAAQNIKDEDIPIIEQNDEVDTNKDIPF